MEVTIYIGDQGRRVDFKADRDHLMQNVEPKWLASSELASSFRGVAGRCRAVQHVDAVEVKGCGYG